MGGFTGISYQTERFKCLVIVFDSEDRKIYNLSEGDIVDLDDMTVTKKEQEEADMNISNILTKQRMDENEPVQTQK